MKNVFTCLLFALLTVLVGCSSDSSTSSSPSTNHDATDKDFHVTFKYSVALNGKTGETSSFLIVANLDFEFQGNNKVKYCPYVDGSGDCEVLAYSLEVDEDGDETYEMSRKGGSVYIAFVPSASDTEGPMLVVLDYEKQIVSVWSTTEKDRDFSIEWLKELLTESDS